MRNLYKQLLTLQTTELVVPAFEEAAVICSYAGYQQELRYLPFLSWEFYRDKLLLASSKQTMYTTRRRTRLMSLARKGDTDRVALLVKSGAAPDVRDADNASALLYAAAGGHLETV